jgi:hypothetical protein
MVELVKDYGVFGDYGYVTENLLFETNSVNAAIEWAERYTRNDMGGYSVVEVGWFAKAGTYETAWTKHAEEDYLYDEA